MSENLLQIDQNFVVKVLVFASTIVGPSLISIKD